MGALPPSDKKLNDSPPLDGKDPLISLPLDGGGHGWGVNAQIVSPLTSILSHRGERRSFGGGIFQAILK
jgi:hypothetical protein